ncbi:MAG: hypothetical protein EP344_05435 [Bacteroidetes bacterium]|nr:MAG: hypothetical protein EP344_05435 [Bacteroidota bacterium]
MRIRSYSILMVMSLSALYVVSCEEDTNTNGPALSGRWELANGFRNGKETETLSGTYFQFDTDGNMITNLPVGPEQLMPYKLEKNIIRQQTTPPVEYEVQTLSDTSLVLGLELRGMQFTMHFVKAEISTPAEHSSELAEPDTLSSDSTSYN